MQTCLTYQGNFYQRFSSYLAKSRVRAVCSAGVQVIHEAQALVARYLQCHSGEPEPAVERFRDVVFTVLDEFRVDGDKELAKHITPWLDLLQQHFDHAQARSGPVEGARSRGNRFFCAESQAFGRVTRSQLGVRGGSQ